MSGKECGWIRPWGQLGGKCPANDRRLAGAESGQRDGAFAEPSGCPWTSRAIRPCLSVQERGTVLSVAVVLLGMLIVDRGPFGRRDRRDLIVRGLCGRASAQPRHALTGLRFHGPGCDICWRPELKTGAEWEEVTRRRAARCVPAPCSSTCAGAVELDVRRRCAARRSPALRGATWLAWAVMRSGAGAQPSGSIGAARQNPLAAPKPSTGRRFHVPGSDIFWRPELKTGADWRGGRAQGVEVQPVGHKWRRGR